MLTVELVNATDPAVKIKTVATPIVSLRRLITVKIDSELRLKPN